MKKRRGWKIISYAFECAAYHYLDIGDPDCDTLPPNLFGNPRVTHLTDLEVANRVTAFPEFAFPDLTSKKKGFAEKHLHIDEFARMHHHLSKML
jgi:hypothetical protein